MSYARHPNEDKFVNDYLKKEIHCLGVDSKLQRKFLEFAVKHGAADKKRFPPRLNHVIKGRTPSAYIAVLISRFFSERRYEDFVRIIKDHVEYITSDGNASELEEIVTSHPLMLRITRVRMTDWVVTGKPTSIEIYLRSPIKEPAWTDLDDEATINAFDKHIFEFCQWLNTQVDMPETHRLGSGDELDIRYDPDWMRYADEDGFESYSNLGGLVDITQGIFILLYSAFGTNCPDIPRGLDTFYHLSELFDGTEASPAPKNLTFRNYWPRVVDGGEDLLEIFFAHFDLFPKDLRLELQSFFKSFADQHKNAVAKAIVDRKVVDEKGDRYIPNVEDVTHYAELTELFFKQFKPILQSHWNAFAKTALEILGIERVRARKHYAKARKILR